MGTHKIGTSISTLKVIAENTRMKEMSHDIQQSSSIFEKRDLENSAGLQIMESTLGKLKDLVRGNYIQEC